MFKRSRSAKLIAMFMSLIMAMTIFGVNTSVIFAEGEEPSEDMVVNEKVINDVTEEQTEENELKVQVNQEEENVPDAELTTQSDEVPVIEFGGNEGYYEEGFPGSRFVAQASIENDYDGCYKFEWELSYQIKRGDDDWGPVDKDSLDEYFSYKTSGEYEGGSEIEIQINDNCVPGRVVLKATCRYGEDLEKKVEAENDGYIYIFEEKYEDDIWLELSNNTDAILGETKNLEVELYSNDNNLTEDATFEWTFKYDYWNDEKEEDVIIDGPDNNYFTATSEPGSNKSTVKIAEKIPEAEFGFVIIGVVAKIDGEPVAENSELGYISVSDTKYEIKATFNGSDEAFLMLGDNNVKLTTTKYVATDDPKEVSVTEVSVTDNLKYNWYTWENEDKIPLEEGADITVSGLGSEFTLNKKTIEGVSLGVELLDTNLQGDDQRITEYNVYVDENNPVVCQIKDEKYVELDIEEDENLFTEQFKQSEFQMVESLGDGEYANYKNADIDWVAMNRDTSVGEFVVNPKLAEIEVNQVDSTKVSVTPMASDEWALCAFAGNTSDYILDYALALTWLYCEGVDTFKINDRTIKIGDNEPISKSSVNAKAGKKIVLSVDAVPLDVEGAPTDRQFSYEWSGTGIDGKIITSDNSYEFKMSDGAKYYGCNVTDGYNTEFINFSIDNGSLNLFATPKENYASGRSEVMLDPTQQENVTLKVDVEYDGDEPISYVWYRDDSPITEESELDESMPATLMLDQTDADNVGEYECRVFAGDEESSVWFNVEMKQTITILSPEGYDKNESDDIEVLLELDENNNVKTQQGYVLAKSSAPDAVLSYTWYYSSFDEYYDDGEGTEVKDGSICTFDKEGTYKCQVTDGYNETNVWYLVEIDSGLSVEYADEEYYGIGDPELENGAVYKAIASSSKGLSLQYKWYAWTYNDENQTKECKLIKSSSENTCNVTFEYPIYRYTCDVTDGISTRTILYYFEVESGLKVEINSDEKDQSYDLNDSSVPETAEFSIVEATSEAGKVNFKWYKESEDGGLIPLKNENKQSLTLPITTENAGYYVCIANDKYNCRYKYFSLSVEGLNFDGIEVTLADYDKKYDGKPKEPTVIVTKNGNELDKDIDYTVTYRNNVKPTDNAEVIIEGIGKYSGEYITSFEIIEDESKDEGEITTVPIAKSGLTYTGENQKLIEAGSGTGVVEYIISESKPDNDDNNWSNEIPEAADAGNYNVWYKLIGDDEHNDVKVTDDSYVPVTIAKADSAVTEAPTAKTGLEYTGEDLALVNAGEATGGKMKYNLGTEAAAGDNWLEEVPTGKAAGTYYVWYKAAGDKNYNDSEPAYVTVSIAKAATTVTAPTAKTGLEYTGEDLALVNAGEATGGKMKYSLGTEAAAGDNWSEEVPTGKAAGTYYVWYKAAGDKNHNDSEPDYVTASIAKAAGTITEAPTAKSGLAYTGENQKLINAGSGTGTLQYMISDSKPDNDDSGWIENIPEAKAQGTYKVWYKLTGDDNHTNVDVADNLYVEVTIDKAAATVTAPTAKSGLVYNENNQELINGGSSKDGTIKYSLGTEAAAGDNWSEEVPTGKDAGTYYVWYKAFGDENHSDSEQAYVDVAIAKATPAFPETGAISGTCLQTLADVELPENCEWSDETIALETGRTKVAKAIYTPVDIDNYNIVSKNITITVIHEHTNRVTDPAGYMKNGFDRETCIDCGVVLRNDALAGYGVPNVKSFKAKKGKKCFTAKWKKASKKNQKLMNGYQIRYSTNSNMAGAKYTTAGKKAKSKKIKKLAKKTTYYVQMRAYKNTATGPVYSNWTAVKKVKTK